MSLADYYSTAGDGGGDVDSTDGGDSSTSLAAMYASAAESTDDESGSAASNLLAFYGIGGGDDDESTAEAAEPVVEAPRIDPALDLDSEQFEPQTYIDGQLAEKSMKELVERDNALISQKRSLDSEMQMLVYENYSKFIRATDMIRKMKENVESMESQMESLLTNVNSIQTRCTTIESSLIPNRVKIENLVGVSRLLKRLEFLFELPGRLRKSIELEAYEQAVKYFRVSVNILSQYSHLKSFQQIKEESEVIMLDLKAKLRARIRTPSTDLHTRLSTAAMLLDLNDPAADILHPIIVSTQERLSAAMQRAFEQHTLALKRDTHASASSSESSSSSSSSASSASLAVPESATGSTVHRKSSGSSATGGDSTDLIESLSTTFVGPFFLFVSTFLDVLVQPMQTYLRNARKVNKLKEENLRECQTSLASFANALFEQYLQLCRKELLRKANIHSFAVAAAADSAIASAAHADANADANADAGANAISEHPVTLTQAAMAALIKQFTTSVQHFFEHAHKLHALVPDAGLDRRATEIAAHAIRACAESVFEQTQLNALEAITRFHDQVAGRDMGASRVSRASSSSASSSALPQPTAIAARVRKHLDEGLHILVPLLATKSYVPNSTTPLNFNDFTHQHFHQLLHSLVETFTFRVLRKSEGPIFDPIQHLPACVSSLAAVKHMRHPFFYLYMSHVCAQLEQHDFPTLLKLLHKLFPVSARSRHDMAVPTLLARMKENSELLLRRFVELHGLALSRAIRQAVMSTVREAKKGEQGGAVVSEAPNASALVVELRSALARAYADLTLLLPPAPEENDRRGHAPSRSFGGQIGGASARERTVNRDIARLFTAKVSTYDQVQMNRVDPIFALLKIAVRAWQETIRLHRLSLAALAQIEVDVYTVRQLLPLFFVSPTERVPDLLSEPLSFPTSLDEQDSQMLLAQLDEVQNSASERTPGDGEESNTLAAASMLTALSEDQLHMAWVAHAEWIANEGKGGRSGSQ